MDKADKDKKKESDWKKNEKKSGVSPGSLVEIPEPKTVDNKPPENSTIAIEVDIGLTIGWDFSDILENSNKSEEMTEHTVYLILAE